MGMGENADGVLAQVEAAMDSDLCSGESAEAGWNISAGTEKQGEQAAELWCDFWTLSTCNVFTVTTRARK